MDSQESHMESLPDVVLLHIFLFLPYTYSFLNVMRLVNRQWNRVAFDHPVWRRFRIRMDKRRDIHMDDYMAFFTRISPRIHKLQLAVDFCFYPSFLADFPTLPNLVSLDCQDSVKLGRIELEILIKNCPNVTSVRLRRCKNNVYKKIDDNCLIVIAIGWKNLRKIDISRCSRITGPGLIDFVTTLRESLQKIQFDYIDEHTDGIVASLAQILGPSLRAIVLGGDRSNLSESAIVSVAQKCPNLEKLITDDNLCLTDTSIQELLHLHQLQKLEIWAKSTCLAEMFEGFNMPLLRCLNLCDNFLTDDLVELICVNCPSLQMLRIGTYSRDVTDRGIEAILTNCSILVKLQLSVPSITGRNLLRIPVRLSKLKILEISTEGRAAITEETIEELKDLSVLAGFQFVYEESD